MQKYVFISHDVDWRFSGPSKQHILDRKDRFDQHTLDNLDTLNPYNNFETIMDIEEKHDFRSTFFFRTKYEDGDFREYRDQIHKLEQGGWEIGLHLDPDSIYSSSDIKQEYDDLSSITKNRIIGNRVHYLNYNDSLLSKLKDVGIEYDSSLKHSKNKLVDDDFGFYKKEIIQFPITIADVFLFACMGINEKNMISFIESALARDNNVLSIIWHDNVLRMKGGRMYAEIIKYLHSKDIIFCTGKQMCDLVNTDGFK